MIALDAGRVACVLFTQHEKRTSVYPYNPDPGIWGTPHIIGEGFRSKRASAIFDPGSRRLHVVYTDAAGDARHRALTAPYGLGNWCPGPPILYNTPEGIESPRPPPILAMKSRWTNTPGHGRSRRTT